jgi:hypothetical protein
MYEYGLYLTTAAAVWAIPSSTVSRNGGEMIRKAKASPRSEHARSMSLRSRLYPLHLDGIDISKKVLEVPYWY